MEIQRRDNASSGAIVEAGEVGVGIVFSALAYLRIAVHTDIVNGQLSVNYF
jgi:hypothetical protein